MFKEKVFDTGDLTLNYVETGNPASAPLVLLHGLSGRWQAWSEEIGLLSHRWHVYAVDARGHGGSSWSPDHNYDMDLQVEDAARFIEDVVGGPAVVVGHSMGAITSIGLAGTRPELIRAAVLEDPPAYIIKNITGTDFNDRFIDARQRMRDGMPFDQLVDELCTANPGAPVTAARSTAASHVALDPEVWTPHIDGSSMDRFDMDSTLKKIQCPVLLLQADSAMGAALLPGEEERMMNLIEDCTLVQFDGIGHGIHKDDPIRFRRVLFDFLDTI